jgi:hypothetical protein
MGKRVCKVKKAKRSASRTTESLQKRQEQQPAAVRDIARELAGFVWSIGQHVTIGG